MELTATVWWAGCAIALFIGGVCGFLFGANKSRRQRRTLQRSLNDTNLELLDARKEAREMAEFLGDAERKDRLLKLTLKKLTSGNQAVNALQQNLQTVDRKHFIEMSRLNMSAVEADQKANKATEIAREAIFRLRLLESALPQLQTITTHEPKSYGQGDAVTVSVVNQQMNSAKHDHTVAEDSPTHAELPQKSVEMRPDNTVNFPPNGLPKPAQKVTSDNTAEQSLRKKETAKHAN